MSDATAPPRAATEASVFLDPGGRAAGPVRHTLPAHLTSFVGRRAELAAVSALLRGRRLVALTGVGGSGKTRLAAQLAADQAERWPDGVWWVELEAVTDSTQVAEVAAATIGVLVEPVQARCGR
jgi:AAA ATPase domain